MSGILVVAATSRELALLEGVSTLTCGIGPVEAAIATTRELAERRAATVLHIGVAGARELPIASLVLGSESIYCDAEAAVPVVDRIPADPQLLGVARTALPEARVLQIGTSARVGGTRGVQVEAMEGFGVLRAAQLAGVPGIELRAVSNEVDEWDRSLWDLDAALSALAQAVPPLIASITALMSSSP
jgi:futalosine hydrolase